MATTKMPHYSNLLQKAHHFFLILGGIYVLLLVLGGTPFMQRQYVAIFNIPHRSCDHIFFGSRLIYMHNVKVPLFPRYDIPEKHDLARKWHLTPTPTPISTSHHFFTNLIFFFSYPQHSKPTTCASKRPITRR